MSTCDGSSQRRPRRMFSSLVSMESGIDGPMRVDLVFVVRESDRAPALFAEQADVAEVVVGAAADGADAGHDLDPRRPVGDRRVGHEHPIFVARDGGRERAEEHGDPIGPGGEDGGEHAAQAAVPTMIVCAFSRKA